MNPTTPDEFIASLPAERQDTMRAVHAAIRKAAPKLAPEIMKGMGGPLIAYGKYHYKSASGREGDWFLIGLAAGITTTYYPAASEAIIYLIMLIVLVVRPRGLFGEEGLFE